MSDLSREVTKYFSNRSNAIVTASNKFFEKANIKYLIIFVSQEIYQKDTVFVYGHADLIMLALSSFLLSKYLFISGNTTFYSFNR